MVITPPSAGAVSDAFTVLKLIQDPKAAEELLSHLAEATQQHQAAIDELQKKSVEVAKALQDVAAREAAVAKQEAQLKQNTAAVDQHLAELIQAGKDLEAQKKAHAETVSAHNVSAAELAQNKKEAEEYYGKMSTALTQRTQELDVRQRALDVRARQLGEREAQLKALLSAEA